MIDASVRIHPTADLEQDVVVGPGSAIWHRAQVRAGARIGALCVIGRDAFIDEGVSIGDRVKIQNGALIYHGVTVEDGVFVGPGAILTNDRYPRAITSSGDLATAEDWTVGPITLHRGSSIGAGAVIVAGVEIHEFATVGAGAVVTRSVPAHALVVGNPARRIGWVCTCGMRLETLDGTPGGSTPGALGVELRCPTCGRTYAFHDAPDRLEEHALSSPVAGT
jgi:UDP-2-acetamido-3-amino-2,3-dideoxy-glucuronate N-acetyltransferase